MYGSALSEMCQRDALLTLKPLCSFVTCPPQTWSSRVREPGVGNADGFLEAHEPHAADLAFFAQAVDSAKCGIYVLQKSKRCGQWSCKDTQR